MPVKHLARCLAWNGNSVSIRLKRSIDVRIIAKRDLERDKISQRRKDFIRLLNPGVGEKFCGCDG